MNNGGIITFTTGDIAEVKDKRKELEQNPPTAHYFNRTTIEKLLHRGFKLIRFGMEDIEILK